MARFSRNIEIVKEFLGAIERKPIGKLLPLEEIMKVFILNPNSIAPS